VLVRIYGFSFEIDDTNKISLSEYFEYLSQNKGIAVPTSSADRRLYFDYDPAEDFSYGLMVTVKDQKTFCKLQQQDGGLVISVENLTGADKLMEFNFFVVNNDNGFGAFQHYHQSCSVGEFNKSIEAQFRKFRSSLSERDRKAQEDAQDEELTQKQIRDINREYACSLKGRQLIRKEDLTEILESLNEINSFSYDFISVGDIEKHSVALAGGIERARERIVFSPQKPKNLLIQGISDLMTVFRPKSGSVAGKTDNGKKISYDIYDIPQNFGEEDYDDLAAKLNDLNLDNFESNEVLESLETLCTSNEHKHIFCV
jgi:hypothetical protein